MILLCSLLLWSCLCGLLAINVHAQDGQNNAGLHHHPPQDQLLHEKFYSTWHMRGNPSVSCCNNADCYPAEVKYIDGDIYAKCREDGRYIRIPPEKVERNRDNLAEITSALHRRMSSTDQPAAEPSSIRSPAPTGRNESAITVGFNTEFFNTIRQKRSYNN